MSELVNCKCGAPAVILSPGGFYERDGYHVQCLRKQGFHKGKVYKRKGNAVRYWNLNNE